MFGLRFFLSFRSTYFYCPFCSFALLAVFQLVLCLVKLFKKAFLVAMCEQLFFWGGFTCKAQRFLDFEEEAIKDLEHSPVFLPKVPQPFPSPITSLPSSILLHLVYLFSYKLLVLHFIGLIPLSGRTIAKESAVCWLYQLQLNVDGIELLVGQSNVSQKNTDRKNIHNTSTKYSWMSACWPNTSTTSRPIESSSRCL